MRALLDVNVLIALLDENHTHNACRNLSNQRQLTDVYLLALAVEHGCRLVTFDTGISLVAARRADPSSLVVI